MANRPKVARTIKALRRAVELYRKANKSVALVPTMGALHAGHLALVREAKRRARRVVVSIFVNPTQFAPTEDFGSYPRTFASDLKALTAAKIDLVWAPTAKVMYPQGFATRIEPQGAAKAGLEDKFRPHFFGGVATVVAKLFTQVEPDFALFGEKDYQQLCVVRQMAKDLDLAAEGRRRENRARERRLGAVVAQRLSFGRRTQRRARAPSRAQSERGAHQTRRADRAGAGCRAQRDRRRRLCARLSGSAPCARRLRQSILAKTGRSGFWLPPRSARPD